MTKNSETPDASGKRMEMDRRRVLRAAAVAGVPIAAALTGLRRGGLLGPNVNGSMRSRMRGA